MDAPPSTGVLRFGAFTLDIATGELRGSPEPAPITLGARPARLLVLLAWHHGQLVTRDEIRAHVWADGTTVDFDQSINQYIRQLRQVLGDDAVRPVWIQTLPARGYRFLVASELAIGDPVTGGADVRDAPVPPSRRRRLVGAATLAGLAFAASLFATPESGSVTDAVRPAADHAAVRLAVLPLETDDAGEAVRALGLTDELITTLGEAYAPSLEVIALRTVMRYRGSAIPLPALARQLGVDFVLEGRLRAQLDRVRITVRLVRASDSAQLWARTFELTSQQGWAIEAAVSQDVAASLGRVLVPHRARPDAVLDVDAQQDYLRGRTYLRRGNPRRAAQALTAVTARAPRSARAWAALGLAELHSGGERFAAAAAAASTALELDPAQAEAHYVRAVVAMYAEWDIDRARAHLEAAIAANPAFAEAHHDLAACYSAAGRHDEALAAMRRAFALDPLAPEVVSDVGIYYYFARRYAEAAQWCKRTLALDAGFYWAHRCIVLSRLRQGDQRAAIAAALDDLRARRAPPPVIAAVAATGLAPYWRWEIDRVSTSTAPPGAAQGATSPVAPEQPIDFGDRAASRLGAGDPAGALDDLERAVTSRRSWLLPFLGVDPTFDELRGQPRFEAVRRTVAAGAAL